jgi:hypothetical protein
MPAGGQRCLHAMGYKPLRIPTEISRRSDEPKGTVSPRRWCRVHDLLTPRKLAVPGSLVHMALLDFVDRVNLGMSAPYRAIIGHWLSTQHKEVRTMTF